MLLARKNQLNLSVVSLRGTRDDFHRVSFHIDVSAHQTACIIDQLAIKEHFRAFTNGLDQFFEQADMKRSKFGLHFQFGA